MTPVERRRFKVGKYDILAQPAAGSMHMLRYTVMLDGRKIGSQLSVPSESDCRFMEAPPVVPPLRIFSVTFRPGRPKKGSVRPGSNAEEAEGGVALPWSIKNQKRY
jgi:hypothetical protein